MIRNLWIFTSVWLGISFLLLYFILSPKQPASIRFTQKENGSISFKGHEVFFKSLPTIRPAESNRFQDKFYVIGQIISQTIPSGLLRGHKQIQIHLSNSLSKELGILNQPMNVNTAIGIFSVSNDLEDRISVGQSIEVSFYSIRNSFSKGTILKKIPTANGVRVVFSLADGKEWYPGANCEIHIPNIKLKPLQIPVNAIVHYQKRDVVYIKLGNSDILEKEVHIVLENNDSFEVIGLEETDQVVIDKAILLKPLFAEQRKLQ